MSEGFSFGDDEAPEDASDTEEVARGRTRLLEARKMALVRQPRTTKILAYSYGKLGWYLHSKAPTEKKMKAYFIQSGLNPCNTTYIRCTASSVLTSLDLVWDRSRELQQTRPFVNERKLLESGIYFDMLVDYWTFLRKEQSMQYSTISSNHCRALFQALKTRRGEIMPLVEPVDFTHKFKQQQPEKVTNTDTHRHTHTHTYTHTFIGEWFRALIQYLLVFAVVGSIPSGAQFFNECSTHNTQHTLR